MLFTITATCSPAIDLGFLLHKRPDRTQTFELTFGQAHVFYSEAMPERCTADLLLDINPVNLVRGGSGSFAIAQHCQQLRRLLPRLKQEGFRRVFVLNSAEEVAGATITREPLWANKKEEHGPFDITGDIHGYFDELVQLLQS